MDNLNDSVRNEHLISLTQRLGNILYRDISRPTEQDYQKVVDIKETLDQFPGKDNLDDNERDGYHRLVAATDKELEKYRAFFERNNHKWFEHQWG